MKFSKILLFDIDATLLKSGYAGNRALNRAFYLLYGLSDAMGGIRPDGKTDPLIIREVLVDKLSDLNPDLEIPRVAEIYLKFLEEEVAESPAFQVMPGVQELLQQIYKIPSLCLGLATGNFESGARIKLQRAGLDGYFSFGGYGSDAENRTELVQVAIQRAEQYMGGAVPRDIVYVIGDTPRDIKHAKEAGVKTVAVATGRSGLDELAGYNPDHLFFDLSCTADLLQIFLRK